ncbi:MAG: HEPN domain-containing protein [Defluviitaleaceae bacterium]|nr:HEPN domain-containing protein [Defluviitaleaceae bacterium]MCL2261919.1 HEPN domain-containing protein [Defluviitaleaceae bacterium]
MLTDNRIALAQVRIDHAKEDLLTAEENYKNKRYKAVNNRVYYAIFHSIRAILALDGVDFKSHSSVLGYFNKNYIHTNILDRSLGSAVVWASKARNDSDYNDFYTIIPEDVKSNIESARVLFSAVEEYIEKRLSAEGDSDPI